MCIPSIASVVLNDSGGRYNGFTNITAGTTITLSNHYTVPWTVPFCDILTIAIFVLFLVCLRFFFPKAQKPLSVSHFSIQVDNLPKDATESEVENFFSHYGQVNKVCMALNNGKLLIKVEEHRKLLEKMDEFKNDGREDSYKRGKILGLMGESIDTLNEKIETTRQEIATLEQEKYHCCGIAFVTFENQSTSTDCIHKSARDLFLRNSYRFRDTITLQVSHAPDPQDIIWENLEYNVKQRFVRRVIVEFITFVLAALAVLQGIGIGAWVYESRFSGRESPQVIYFILLCVIIGLAMLSLMVLTPILSKFEKHHHKSRLRLYAGIRFTVFEMILGVAIPITMFHFLFDDEGTLRMLQDFMPQAPLMVEAFIIIGIINFFIPLMYRLIVWYVTIRKERKEHELRRKFTSAEFPTDESHKFIVKSIVSTLFFSSLAPIIIVVMFVVAVAYYAVEKFNILKRFKRTTSNDNTISVVMIRYLLPIGVLAHFAVGARVYFMHDQASGMYWTMIIPLVILAGFYFLSIVFDVVMYIVTYFRPSVQYNDFENNMTTASEIEGLEMYGAKPSV
jgi:hypothetical protein